MNPLRQCVRAITDALPAKEWLPISIIYDRLPKPKPTRNYLCICLGEMTRAGQLRRRKRPKGSARGVRHVYRSGRQPVIDGRLRNGRTGQHFVGFMELGRRERRAKQAERGLAHE